MVSSAAPANRVASLLLPLDQIDGQTSPDVIAGTHRNGFDEAAGTLTSDWILYSCLWRGPPTERASPCHA